MKRKRKQKMENDLLHAEKKENFNATVVEGIDRLSNLPDHVLLLILSMLDTREAVRTSILSKRWIHLWTYVDQLNFEYKYGQHVNSFVNFVLNVLQHRKSLNLSRVSMVTKVLIFPIMEDVIKYAESHNVEEIEIDRIDDLPRGIHESQTIKSLKCGPGTIRATEFSFAFAYLTSLQLFDVRVRSRNSCTPFSNCLNLENLSLIRTSVSIKHFCISAPRLMNLIISKHNTCRPHFRKKLIISGPSLKYLNFDGNYPIKIEVDKRCSVLEDVKIHMHSSSVKWVYISQMMPFAEKLAHAKRLTISFRSSVGKCLLKRDGPDDEIRIVEND